MLTISYVVAVYRVVRGLGPRPSLSHIIVKWLPDSKSWLHLMTSPRLVSESKYSWFESSFVFQIVELTQLLTQRRFRKVESNQLMTQTFVSKVDSNQLLTQVNSRKNINDNNTDKKCTYCVHKLFYCLSAAGSSSSQSMKAPCITLHRLHLSEWHLSERHLSEPFSATAYLSDWLLERLIIWANVILAIIKYSEYQFQRSQFERVFHGYHGGPFERKILRRNLTSSSRSMCWAVNIHMSRTYAGKIQGYFLGFSNFRQIFDLMFLRFKFGLLKIIVFKPDVSHIF